MKHSAREADRRERAYLSANRAMADDCKRELSPEFLARIRSKLADPQKRLFSERLSETCASNADERGTQVLEQDVVANLRRRETCGQSGKNAAVGAIADAISRRKEAQFRAMEGHWLNKGGASTAPAIEAAKRVLNALSSTDLASRILEGQMDGSVPERQKKKVNLDEDLR